MLHSDNNNVALVIYSGNLTLGLPGMTFVATKGIKRGEDLLASYYGERKAFMHRKKNTDGEWEMGKDSLCDTRGTTPYRRFSDTRGTTPASGR